MDKAGAQYVHIDVMDGSFVPNLSFGYSTVKAVNGISDLVLDVHLMIDRPIRYVEEFIKAGADWLTIHVEADQPQNTLAALDKIRELGCKAAISLKPRTPVEAAIPYLEKCDMILVMTVEPGFGGQKFIPESLDKIRFIKSEITKRGLSTLIEVDGGVSADNAATLFAAGADVLVAGSAVFGAESPIEAIRSMKA